MSQVIAARFFNPSIGAFLFLIIGICACQTHTQTEKHQAATLASRLQRPVALDQGKVFEKDGVKMLYGGPDSLEHFDITNSELKDEQYHYGIGREAFAALLHPEFISVEQADQIWSDTIRFLVAFDGGDVKAYSIPDLTRHEIVNDVLNGKPIMAAYCVLADLGAVYERSYGEQELTFALSGYTYYDDEVWDGMDGFVFWDRETESLWWPLIGRAVSGKLKGMPLVEMDNQHWVDTHWLEVKRRWPDAQVLRSGQDFVRPTSWPKINDVSSLRAQFGQ